MAHRSQEPLLPSAYWGKLTQEDKNEFQRLRNHFHQSQKISSKDPRLVSFSNELHAVLKYIEHTEQQRECRTILTGVAFAGAFICVNTRQLKSFLGRCKSSINGSFQQLGYVAIKTKSKARSCVLAILPSLINDQNILRQWTVRCASDDAKFCFVTSLTSLQLPIITNDDLNDDHRNNHQQQLSAPIQTQQTQQSPSQQLQQQIQFQQLQIPEMQALQTLQTLQAQQMQQLQAMRHVSWSTDIAQVPDMPISYSVECFTSVGDYFPEPNDYAASEWNPMYEKTMTRSSSANFANDTYGAYTLDFSMF